MTSPATTSGLISASDFLDRSRPGSTYLPEPGTFRASYVEHNITPLLSNDHTLELQGDSLRRRRAEGIGLPLTLQVLLLEDDHLARILIVTADIFGFSHELVRKLRALAWRWGVPPEAVILSASHTQDGPGTIDHVAPEMGRYQKDFVDQLFYVLGESFLTVFDKSEPCALVSGCTAVRIGADHRTVTGQGVHFQPNEDGLYDTTTPFLRIQLLDSQKKLLLINHACHPSRSRQDHLISSSYPGYMRQALIEMGAADSILFIQGACGTTSETSGPAGRRAFCQTPEESRLNGLTLARSVVSAMDELRPVRGRISATCKRWRMPLAEIPSEDQAEALAANPGNPSLISRWAEPLLKRFPEGHYPRESLVETQTVALGDHVVFVTFPGEPSTSSAIAIRTHKANGSIAFIGGCCNGLTGYLPTDRMIKESGLEGDIAHLDYITPSRPDVGTYEAMLDAVQQGLDSNAQRNGVVSYGNFDCKAVHPRAFFTLSTGRCGTMTLSRVLNLSEHATVHHEPLPDLHTEQLGVYWNKLNPAPVFWQARYQYLYHAWGKGTVYGETNDKMTFFASSIARELPEARFIVLVRHPMMFVRSALRRNYFKGSPFDYGRIQPAPDLQVAEEWATRDAFSKCCWFWNATYTYAHLLMEELGRERVTLVRFEDLIAMRETTEELYDFLGLQGFSSDPVAGVLATPGNDQPHAKYPPPQEWPHELKKILWDECGATASACGYEPDLF